jgi:hypothetical protein
VLPVVQFKGGKLTLICEAPDGFKEIFPGPRDTPPVLHWWRTCNRKVG